MIQALYTATSGALGFQNKLNVVANNLANASTTGYKPTDASFTDLVYTDLPGGEEGKVQLGNGVRMAGTSPVFEQGALEETGRPLDTAIAGDGFYALLGADGETYYSRDGSFSIQSTENGNVLVNANGDRVLNDRMEPVALESADAEPTLAGPSADGAGDDGAVHLAVVEFPNPYALANSGDNRYTATAQSGGAQLYADGRVIQGSLEHSSVDVAGEMYKLIESQRGFQMNAKVIQTADELENMANSLR